MSTPAPANSRGADPTSSPTARPTSPSSSRLTVTTREIADPHGLLDRLPPDGPLAWVRDGEGLVAWGVTARLEVRGDERFSRTQRWWSTLCDRFEVDDTVSMPGTGPVAFGSFSFDPVGGTSVIIVPRIVVGRRAGQAWLTVISDPEGPAGSVAAVPPVSVPPLSVPPVSVPPVSVPAAPTAVTWREGSLSVADWAAAVDDAVARIHAGEIDKVVLARDVVADVTGPLDVRYLLQRLAAEYPSCWTFSVADLIGATPELLVRRTGDVVTSRVLAGTVRRRGDDHADAGLARALLDSDKDTEEHEFAVRSVAKALAAHCTDLDVPQQPHVLELANVQHLATDVTGRLADSATVLALAASLHPTAAVCGTPTERAFALIGDLEQMDRGRYAGPVGWFDRFGDGEFGIALRCAQIDATQGRVRAYAGCGIVAGSDAAAEVAESNAKLIPIRQALGD